jgi:glycosyltransferase involved in cell wall biosynthesis
MDGMKIVHVVYSLEMGGAEVLVRQLCTSQRADGHDVSVIAYARLGVTGEAMVADGFTIRVLGEAHPLKSMLRCFKRFRAIRPDVVHCHNVAPTTHAAIPGWLARVRCVISTRHRLEYFPYDWKGEAQYNFMGWFCDWVVGICEVTCENVRKGPLAWKKKIVLVYNGTEPVERVSAQQLEKLGSRKRGFTLVFVGRVVREKALETLVRAVSLAKQRVPGLALWIVGGGAARAELEALAAELGVSGDVTFWGQQTRTAPFFSAADAFVMSSISEGLPMSLLQSMSLGTPAIVTDVDGMGEVLRLTQSGLLVPVGDAAAFAEAIVRLAGDEAQRLDLSRRALEAYRTRFTVEKMAQGYMELYRGRVGV